MFKNENISESYKYREYLNTDLSRDNHKQEILGMNQSFKLPALAIKLSSCEHNKGPIRLSNWTTHICTGPFSVIVPDSSSKVSDGSYYQIKWRRYRTGKFTRAIAHVNAVYSTKVNK